jgi:hypothetical protein
MYKQCGRDYSLESERFNLHSYFCIANWKGFHDDESGLQGFTWAIGRNVCGTDLVQFNDPYVHLTSKKFWTDSGFHKGIHLDDGPYYITVQALNGAELGGSLVILLHSPLIQLLLFLTV